MGTLRGGSQGSVLLALFYPYFSTLPNSPAGLKSSLNLTKMGTHREPVTPPAWNTPHKKGYEIPTVIKNAICQSYAEGKKRYYLEQKYNLGQSIIRKVLFYPKPQRARPGRTGMTPLLSDAKVDEIIFYLSQK
jgi:hypothetical protein